MKTKRQQSATLPAHGVLLCQGWRSLVTPVLAVAVVITTGCFVLGSPFGDTTEMLELGEPEQCEISFNNCYGNRFDAPAELVFRFRKGESLESVRKLFDGAASSGEIQKFYVGDVVFRYADGTVRSFLMHPGNVSEGSRQLWEVDPDKLQVLCDQQFRRAVADWDSREDQAVRDASGSVD